MTLAFRCTVPTGECTMHRGKRQLNADSRRVSQNAVADDVLSTEQPGGAGPLGRPVWVYSSLVRRPFACPVPLWRRPAAAAVAAVANNNGFRFVIAPFDARRVDRRKIAPIYHRARWNIKRCSDARPPLFCCHWTPAPGLVDTSLPRSRTGSSAAVVVRPARACSVAPCVCLGICTPWMPWRNVDTDHASHRACSSSPAVCTRAELLSGNYGIPTDRVSSSSTWSSSSPLSHSRKPPNHTDAFNKYKL